MSRIVINEATRTTLKGIGQSTLLCDENGNVVGMYIPTSQLNTEPYLSPQEIERRSVSTKTYSTKQVLEFLETLP